MKMILLHSDDLKSTSINYVHVRNRKQALVDAGGIQKELQWMKSIGLLGILKVDSDNVPVKEK